MQTSWMVEKSEPVNRKQATVILFALFLSGAGSLVSEVVWGRMLSISLGATVHAATAVLVSFMCGLAAGGLAGGAAADRVKRPFLLLAGIQAAAGVFILFSIPLLALPAGHGMGGFAFSILILLLPSALMGAVFPVSARIYIEQRGSRAGQRTGIMNSCNVFGAVLGVFSAGFYLAPLLGHAKTLGAASVLYLLAALLVATSGWRSGSSASPETEKRTRRIQTNLPAASLLFFFSGFILLGYEILWTRMLVFYIHNSVYAFSAMLLPVIMGIAFGSFVFSLFLSRVDPVRLVALAFSLTGIAGAASVLLLDYLPDIAESYCRLIPLGNWWSAVLLMIMQSAIIESVPAVLAGMVFPALAALCIGENDKAGKSVGMLLFANSLGAAAGAFTVTYLAVPILGLSGVVKAVSLMAIILGPAALFLFPADGPSTSMVWKKIVLRIAAFLPAAILLYPALNLILPESLFNSRLEKAFGKVLFYEESLTGSVAVTEKDGERFLRFADGRGSASTLTVQENRLLGHIPLLLHPDPADICIIGFGAGNTAGAVACHPVLRIDVVELGSGAPEASRFFPTSNNVIDDSRLTMHIEDGRSFLRRSEIQYDVILVDPPEMHSAGVAYLFTNEFYRLCRERLKSGGLLAEWSNILELSERELRMIARTITCVFPHTSVWQSPNMADWITVSFKEAPFPDFYRFRKAYSRRDVMENMKEVGLILSETASSLLMDEAKFCSFGQGAEICTDNRTRLDFTAPRLPQSAFGLDNRNQPVSVAPFIEKAVDPNREGDHFYSGYLLALRLASDRDSSVNFFTGHREGEFEGSAMITEVTDKKKDYYGKLLTAFRVRLATGG